MHVFTYGSLMFPAIWQRVVRGAYRSEPAVLHDHARFALVDDTYPGVVPDVAAIVEGVLYRDVDMADIVALDTFEGSEYRRETVTVTLASGARAMAQTYVFLATHRLSAHSWEPQAFRMSRFIDTYCAKKIGGQAAD